MLKIGYLKQNAQIVIKYLCLIIITTIAITMFIYVIRSSPTEAESPSYVLPTIAMVNRLSYSINQSDIDAARVSFPKTWSHVFGFDDLYGSKLVIARDGRWYSFYFITYSIICIPLYLLFRLFGIDQMLAFPITNLLIYIFSLLVVYLFLDRSYRRKLVTIMLLVCNPIIFYINWVSAEVFMFSMIVISLVFFSNNAYKRAGLFISIAGSMNVTIMVCGLAMILHYFIFMKIKYRTYLSLIKNKWKDIVLYACCFLPGIIPTLFGLSAFTMSTLGSALTSNSESNTISRVFAYLFDLNFGLLPYFAIALTLYFCISVYGLFRKDYSTVCYLLAFVGTIFAYSLMTHINSGMTGIARYNAWVNPIMIFYFSIHGIELMGEKVKRKYDLLTLMSAGLTAMIVLLYSASNAVFFGSLRYNMPIARLVLDNAPQFYNPLYSTFLSRTDHVDSYLYTSPVIYMDSEGIIRKILVTPDTVAQLYSMVLSNDDGMRFIDDKVQSISNKSGYQYINIPRYSSIILKKMPPIGINTSLNIGDDGLISGNYPNEGDFYWCNQNATIVLSTGNKSEYGMQMQISLNGAWFIANGGKEFELQIIIDGQYAKSFSTLTPGIHIINIEPSLFPTKESSELNQYQIELKTNGYFDPSEMPELFGLGAPSRELSFMLHSFEEIMPLRSINAAAGEGDNGFVSGNYPKEGDFYWCKQDVIIELLAGYKTEYGMQIEILLDGSWFIANSEKEFEFQVVVDSYHIKTFSTLDPGMHVINIEPSLFPPAEPNDIYKIELKANGYFDPMEMPEQYGDNAPSRELSFRLYSIEESNE